MDLTSRFLGLVVVPGEYVVRIEVEEFVSQLAGRREGGEGVVVGDGAVEAWERSRGEAEEEGVI